MVTRDVFCRYDTDRDEWDMLEPFPGGRRSYAAGAVHAGENAVYFGFGRSASNRALRDLWRWDGEVWLQRASCPQGCERLHPALVALDQHIFVAAGSGATGNLVSAWAYSIASDSWEQLAPLPGPARHHPYQFALGGRPYVFGGHGSWDPTTQASIYSDLYRWDMRQAGSPATGLQWTGAVSRLRSLPGEGRVAGTQFDLGGYGYVLSGDGQDHRSMQTGEFWRYDPNSNDWTQLPPHPGASRWAPASFVLAGRVHMYNGYERLPGQLAYYPDTAFRFQL